MQFRLSQRTPSLSSAARLLPIAALVALGFLLIASSVGGQTGGDNHGNSFDTATLVELGSSVEGRIDPGDDRDVFKLNLSDASGPTDLWVYTGGEFDTYGGLYDSSGTLVTLNDDGFFEGQIRAFSIRTVVPPDVYYVIAVSYLGEPGDYTLHAQSVAAPGATLETADTLTLGAPDGGRIDNPDGVNYFRLDFTESKHVIIDARSAALVPLDAALLDADGNEISANIGPAALRGFGSLFPIGIEIAEDFEPGTYYLKVTSPEITSPFAPEPEEDPAPDDDSSRTVSYAIFFEEDVEYTELLEDCAADTRALNDPLISDPLYSCQWHLSSSQWQDIDVQSVWEEGIKGEGIGVVVVDDGIYHAHEDLKDNVATGLNFDYGTGGNDIYGRFDHHGTHVAGIIAARDNDIGVRGVAPRATVYGYNFLSGLNSTGLNLLDAMSRNSGVTAVSNNSWGPSDGPEPSRTFSFWRQAVHAGITEGYGGKGTFYAFAAGNGHLLGDDSNLDEFANSHAVTAVCSVHSEGRRAGYSEMGANLWVCAPSNDRPASLGGAHGILTTENSDRYYQDFGGTSAATPLVAGVAALTRDANDDLTWRDIKVILAASASKNDTASSGWEPGARKHPISSTDKYHFNHEYGFGVVNAKGAVALAKRWTTLPEMQDTTVSSGELYVEIPDATALGSATTTTHALTVETEIGFTEFVEVTVSFAHDSFRDLEILLESPSGAISRLAVPFDTYDGLNAFIGDEFVPLYGSFQFGSAKHLGEDPNGEWKLHVTDKIPAAYGVFGGFDITVYGHQRAPGVATLDSVEVNVGGESLDVAWAAPDEAGDSAITSYDIRYVATDEDETDLANWTVLPGVWTADSGGELEYKVAGLTDGTGYDVQVRAVNSAGGGVWSETDAGTPMSSRCVAGGAVTDRENTGLIYDCEALLEGRDILAGIGSLDWSTDTPMAEWEGVTVHGHTMRVTRLDLRDASLSGRLPAALGRLSSLESLLLNRNDLTGSIPASLGNLSNLVVLNLHTNGLSGQIPDLSGMSSLEELFLAKNRLSGSIPESLGGLPSVKELWLWGNELEGPIPDLSGMTSLVRVKLQDNSLTGDVPASFGNMPNLRYLYLHNNPLGGQIPDELGNMTNLRYLWLHSTELSGEIPSELGQLSNLRDLNLRDNELTGSIPAELGGMSSLRLLRLHGNQLTGGIPAELGSLDNLEGLWLHRNQLSGEIPATLGDLGDTLTQWRLAGNNLTGCVPEGLASVGDNDLASLGLQTCSGN